MKKVILLKKSNRSSNLWYCRILEEMELANELGAQKPKLPWELIKYEIDSRETIKI